MRRAVLMIIGTALCTTGCANEPAFKPGAIAPMMLGGPALAGPSRTRLDLSPTERLVFLRPPVAPEGLKDVARKSMAAKVLAARALETVTGLKSDPARLSEHD